MSSLVDFVRTYPAIAVVWFLVMCVSIGFCIVARATHRRNVEERLANRGSHLECRKCVQPRCAPPN
jgi:hypothetical protein